MLEKMKDALSSLSVIAAQYTPKLLKEALLSMAKRTDENTAAIEAMQRDNARAKLAAGFAYNAMLDHPDYPEQAKEIIKKTMDLSEGRDHG